MRKKISKIHIRAFLGLTFCVFACCTAFVVQAQQYAGNQAKTKQENVSWTKAIENWDSTVKTWHQKREGAHATCADCEDSREYCNEKGCWSEGVFDLSFTGKNTSESWDLNKDSSTGDMTGMQGHAWECINAGQVLIYKGSGQEVWESINSGQGIEYKNERGDHWKTINTGQGITFKGVNGDSWDSVNDGQSMDYKDKDGVEWNAINSGQSESYKDDEDEWEGSFIDDEDSDDF